MTCLVRVPHLKGFTHICGPCTRRHVCFQVIKDNSRYFHFKNGFVSLTEEGLRAAQEGPSLPATEDDALHAISRIISRDPNWEMSYRDILQHLDWDTDFGNLGRFSTFMEQHPQWFEIRGFKHHSAVLKSTAPWPPHRGITYSSPR